MEIVTDITYAPQDPPDSRGHLLDLYVPDGDGPFPLVVWSKGSGWRAENGRADAEIVAEGVHRDAFAVAGVSVRSTEHVRFPTPVEDMKTAIAWLQQHAAAHRLDPENIGIMGDSSGGWLAAMTGLSPRLDGAVKAVLAMCPPTDFATMDAQLPPGVGGVNGPDSAEAALIGGPVQANPDLVKAASPLSYVTAEAPPFLVVHGQRDLVVPYAQGEALYRAVAAAGVDAYLLTLPYAEHGPWAGFFDDPEAGKDARLASTVRSESAIQPSWDLVTDFFDAYLR